MASAVATPLEKQFSTIAGIDKMTSPASQGQTSITLQFTRAATSTPPRRTCRRRSRRRCASCRRACSPPSYQKVNPADSPILYLALTSTTLPLSQLDEYAETLHGAAHLDGRRRGAGAGVRLAEVCGARSSSIRRRWPPARSASTKWRRRSPAATSTCRPACSAGPDRAVHRAGERAAHERGGIPPAGRRVPQRRAGASRRTRRGHRRRAEQQGRRAGSTARAASCSRSSASRAPTRWPWPTRCEGGAADARGRRSRRRSRWTSLYDRSHFDPRSRCAT